MTNKIIAETLVLSSFIQLLISFKLPKSHKKLEYQARIDRYREKIAELDQQIKELQNVQNQEKLDQLLQAIAASGKTVDEVMEALNK